MTIIVLFPLPVRIYHRLPLVLFRGAVPKLKLEQIYDWFCFHPSPVSPLFERKELSLALESGSGKALTWIINTIIRSYQYRITEFGPGLLRQFVAVGFRRQGFRWICIRRKSGEDSKLVKTGCIWIKWYRTGIIAEPVVFLVVSIWDEDNAATHLHFLWRFGGSKLAKYFNTGKNSVLEMHITGLGHVCTWTHHFEGCWDSGERIARTGYQPN